MSKLDAAMLHISRNRQLFLDSLILEQVQDVTRTLHRPQKVAENPLVSADQPWEGVTYFACNTFQVVYDAKDDRFKCLYTDWHWDAKEYAKRRNWHDTDISLLRQAYAESGDGLRWTKPVLGRVQENGQDTNLVWGGGEIGTVYCNAVIEDPHAAAEDKRWKCLYVHDAPGIHTIEAGYSANLIDWTPYPSLPVFGTRTYLNDVMTIAYDPYARLFILMTREPIQAYVPPLPGNPHSDSSFFSPHYPHDITRMNKRRIWQCLSADFLHWSPPVPHTYKDDYPKTQLYTNSTVPCPGAEHIYLSFPNRYVQYRIPDPDHKEPGVNDALFMCSRDCASWTRYLDAWVRPGLDPFNWTERNNYPAWGIVRSSDTEWSMYISEHYRRPGVPVRLRRLSIPPYRFVSISAAHTGGAAVTKPFAFTGTDLYLNCSTSAAGGVSVTVLSEDGRNIDGFGTDDMEPYFGDSLSARIRWRGDRKIGELVDRPIRLRFSLNDADIFAMQIR